MTTVAPADFRNAFSKVAATVSVLTTSGPAGLRGLTATSFTSVSDAPPTVLVCVGQGSSSLPMIVENGAFCLNILDENQSAVSDIFAGRRGFSASEKFEHVAWRGGEHGQPVIVDALCALECRLVEHFDVASHKVLIGEVESIAQGAGQKPLVYFQRGYGRIG